MKTTFLKPSLLGLGLLLAGVSVRAQDSVKYLAQPGSSVKIDGTSNIHDWTVNGRIISGEMLVSPAFDKDLKTLSPLPKVDVNIPVRSLKSKERKMDEVMDEHMNMKAYPKIEYRLTAMTLKSEPKSANGPAEFDTTGDLTISGVKKSIQMPVTIERTDGGKLKISGAIALKMTDFKIEPPAPKIAMGLIKTGDDVKLTLEWVLAKAAETASK